MLRILRKIQNTWTDPAEVEDSIRQQVRDLEREAAAFHESIGLLRASLSLASQGETFWRDQQQSMESPSPTDTPDEELPTPERLLLEGWRRERMYAHTLRSLYHNMLETKKRFLYHRHDMLQQQLVHLSPERQPPIRALLQNTLQGLLSVGIEPFEANHRQELQQMLQHQPTFSEPNPETAVDTEASDDSTASTGRRNENDGHGIEEESTTHSSTAEES